MLVHIAGFLKRVAFDGGLGLGYVFMATDFLKGNQLHAVSKDGASLLELMFVICGKNKSFH